MSISKVVGGLCMTTGLKLDAKGRGRWMRFDRLIESFFLSFWMDL